MTKILIFYPHNPVKPQHGSHLRALQQIQGLLDVGRVCLASTEHTSDTLWPKELDGVAAKLGVTGISVFERSEWALRNRIWLAITFVPHALDAIFRRIGLHRLTTNVRAKGRAWMMKRWFRGLVVKNGVELVVVNYTYWSWLVEKIDRRIPCALELHDLISINAYLQKEILKQLLISDRHVSLRANAKQLGYVTNLDQLPQKVRDDLSAELSNIDRFDRIWSIAERESKLIREIDASIPVDTIIPIIRSVAYGCERQEYSLLPTGPNVFNTYSLLGFIERILPKISFVENPRIFVTGNLWSHLKFDCPQGIEYLGMVDNYTKVLGSARFVIVPAAVGTGQQMKIFEALAYGVPVVCFRASVPEFLDLDPKGVVCVNTDEEFAKAISRMWLDETFYEEVSSGARRYSDLPTSNAYLASAREMLRAYA